MSTAKARPPVPAPLLRAEELADAVGDTPGTAKLEDYFSVGVELVWRVDPQRQRVSCYRSPTELTVAGPGDRLTAEPMLPGFVLLVSDLFPGADRASAG